MNKIRKIIDSWKAGVPRCDNNHRAVSQKDFDKLEKDLQKYVDKEKKAYIHGTMNKTKIMKILEKYLSVYDKESLMSKFEQNHRESINDLEKELQGYVDNEYPTIIWDARPFKAKIEFIYDNNEKKSNNKAN